MIGQITACYEVTAKLSESRVGGVCRVGYTHLDRFVAMRILLTEKVAYPNR